MFAFISAALVTSCTLCHNQTELSHDLMLLMHAAQDALPPDLRGLIERLWVASYLL